MKQREIMEKYVAYIDETGSFSYTEKTANAFVAGWVCQADNNLKGKLNKLIQECVNTFNQKREREILHYPDDMHFMPMLTPGNLRTGVNQDIQIDHKDAPDFFKSVFQQMQDHGVSFVFRSMHGPAIISHEQAAYMEILRNTLVQLVDDSFFPQEFSLNIVIAWRRTRELRGYLRNKDLPAYENYLGEQLKEELEQSFRKGFRPEIQVSFGDARKNPGLIMADFFCGAMKKSPSQYLSEFEIKKYPFNKGYKMVGTRITQQMDYLLSQNPAAALMQGAQVYVASPDNKELWSLLNQAHKRLYAEEKKQFYTTIQRYLNDILIDRPDRYDFLDEGSGLITLIQQLLPDDPTEMNEEELRMKAAIDLHEIRISSHRGQTSAAIVETYIGFLHQYKNRLFRNQMAFLQQLIDSTLIGVQVLAFNKLQFDTVEGIIKPVRDLYEKIFSEISIAENMPDENRAKLEGTYGQMCGFQYNLTGEEHYYQQAEKSLQNDVAACLNGSRAWEQGMGFLTALYWRNGKLDQAVEQFLLETQATSFRDGLFDLNRFNLFGGPDKPFFMLHRLYICALAGEQGQAIQGLQTIKGKIGTRKELSRYPKSLSAKWLAVLFMRQDNYNEALNLLIQALGNKDTNDFAIDFVRLPIKILKHMCLQKLSRESSFSMTDEIQHLEHLQEGAGRVLKQLGIERFREYSDEWNPYEIATLPPFYYA